MVHGKWKATTDHISQGVPDEEELLEGSRDFETDRWCLFDLDADFSEAHDVADQHPEVVAMLESLWWTEAGRNNVLPLDDSLVGRAIMIEPSPHPQRYRWSYRPGGRPIAEEATPPLFGGFRVRVAVEPTVDGATGVLCAQGDWNNGWAVLALDGHLAYVLNRFGVPYRVVSDRPIPSGTTELRVEYAREDPGGGSVRLFCDQEGVGEGRLPKDLPFRWQIGGARFHIGLDRGFPVTDDYAVPFPYSGAIRGVAIELPQLAFLEPDPVQVEHFELAAD
jgi:arylsulfatase